MTPQNRGATGGRNRRLSVRRNPKAGVRVACRTGSRGDGKDVAAGVMDMSESGIRLMVTDSLSDGQEVVVSVGSNGHEWKAGGRVMWSLEKVSNGMDWVGVLFTSPMPENTLMELTTLSTDN